MATEEDVVPILRVENAERAVEWYARLGFAQRGETHRFGPGMPTFVTIVRGPGTIYLSEHTGDAPPNSLVYLWVDDVDAIATDFGLVPDEMPWARDIEVNDLDGNRIRIGTPSSGLESP